MTVRIAMWSGPRNISTAMMRSFENRSDTHVSDEPLYAHYLKASGIRHPGGGDVIASQSTHWPTVVEELTGTPPGGEGVWYQKHMTHHMLPVVGRAWLGKMVNCFLIRDPHEVLASYVKRRAEVAIEDLGFPQQASLFDHVCQLEGAIPPVLDAKDVLKDPKRALTALCDAASIPFCESMLTWPPGPRTTDGVWGPHWYDAVYASTSFAPYRTRPRDYPPALCHVAEEAEAIYQRLWAHRL